jgi:hypothetical protein
MVYLYIYGVKIAWYYYQHEVSGMKSSRCTGSPFGPQPAAPEKAQRMSRKMPKKAEKHRESGEIHSCHVANPKKII